MKEQIDLQRGACQAQASRRFYAPDEDDEGQAEERWSLQPGGLQRYCHIADGHRILYGSFQKLGTLLKSPPDRGHSILGLFWGPHLFGNSHIWGSYHGIMATIKVFIYDPGPFGLPDIFVAAQISPEAQIEEASSTPKSGRV